MPADQRARGFPLSPWTVNINRERNVARIDRLLKKAEPHFDNGERALQTVLGVYEITRMGENAVRPGILVATNQRLLFYAKKLVGYDLESYPYANISSIDMGKNLAGTYISFYTSGNDVTLKWITQGDVRAFVDAVKAQMETAKSGPVPPAARSTQSSVDFVEQLERLGKLHQDGVITTEEFSAKKAEILARI